MPALVCMMNEGWCATDEYIAVHHPGFSTAALRDEDLIISHAVGRGGTVSDPDVSKVQAALNNVPVALGGPATKLVVDGNAGPETITAIETFQQFHFIPTDGRVDVLSRTHAKISSLQPPKIRRMIAAKQDLDPALECIKAAIAKLDLARLALTSSTTLFGDAALDHVNRVFDVTKAADPAGAIDFIIYIYRRMQSVFARTGGPWGWKTFEADPFAGRWSAMTWPGGFARQGQFYGCLRIDAIYLSTFYGKHSKDYRIMSIIHELAHFVGPEKGDQILDYGYGTTAKLATLSPYRKQHNAESFGNFAYGCKFGERTF